MSNSKEQLTLLMFADYLIMNLSHNGADEVIDSWLDAVSFGVSNEDIIKIKEYYNEHVITDGNDSEW